MLFYIAIAFSLLIRYLNSNILETPMHDFSIYIYCIALLSTIYALIMYFKAFNMQKYIKDEKKKLTD